MSYKRWLKTFTHCCTCRPTYTWLIIGVKEHVNHRVLPLWLFCWLHLINTSELSFLCVSFLLSPSVHTCIQFHMISFNISFSVIFPFYRHTFHRLTLNVGGLEMKLKALAWMMRSFTLHMHILMYLCVFVVSVDKCLPGEWPEESEAKLCHLVLQPGTDQSALSQQLSLSPSLWFSLLSPFLHISTHALTDRPRLCAVSVELWWPLWGSHAGGNRPGLVLHCDMLASLFLHSAEDLVSSFLLCVKNEIRLCEHFFQWDTNMRRFILKKTEKNMHSNVSVCSTTWYWMRLTVFCGQDLFWSYSVLILYQVFFPVWNVKCLLIKHVVGTGFSGLACNPSCKKILATFYNNS